MNQEQKIKTRIADFAEQSGVPWCEPCELALADWIDAGGDISEIEADECAACVIYFVAVQNSIGGPSGKGPFTPASIASDFGMDRAQMLSAYGTFGAVITHDPKTFLDDPDRYELDLDA